MSFVLSRTRILVCLLVLTVFPPQVQASTATAQEVRSMPVLSIAAAVGPPATMVRVAGEGFTPGGRVYIAIYDRWGVDVYEHAGQPPPMGPRRSPAPRIPTLGMSRLAPSMR